MSAAASGACGVTWCDQGTRPHTRHEVTLGTWRGTAHTAPRRPVDVQLVVHGLSEHEATPMLVLVDRLEQVDVDLDWEQLTKIAVRAISALERFLD